MDTTGNPNAAAGAYPPGRAERLLQALVPVFSHDLPNQLVVVQSLLGLLELEEGDNLSPAVRDFLTRVKGAAKRAANTVQFAKNMAQLARRQEGQVDIPLRSLFEDIQAQLNVLFPRKSITYIISGEVTTVHAGRRLLYGAVVDALRCGLEWCPGVKAILTLDQVRQGNGLRVEFEVTPPAGSPVATAVQEKPTPANRLDLVLAQEMATLAGCTFEVPFSDGSFLIRLLFSTEKNP